MATSFPPWEFFQGDEWITTRINRPSDGMFIGTDFCNDGVYDYFKTPFADETKKQFLSRLEKWSCRRNWVPSLSNKAARAVYNDYASDSGCAHPRMKFPHNTGMFLSGGKFCYNEGYDYTKTPFLDETKSQYETRGRYWATFPVTQDVHYDYTATAWERAIGALYYGLTTYIQPQLPIPNPVTTDSHQANGMLHTEETRQEYFQMCSREAMLERHVSTVSRKLAMSRAADKAEAAFWAEDEVKLVCGGVVTYKARNRVEPAYCADDEPESDSEDLDVSVSTECRSS